MNIIESKCASQLSDKFSMSASSPTSSLTPSYKSPIATLPYDVLYEIFMQCLLIYPLHQRHPRAKTAPILLCHICSSWRRLALAFPTLWTHLSYSSTLVKRSEQIFDSEIESPTSALDFIEGDIEFFRWLKTNQGQIPPFLSLDLDKPTTSDSTRKLTTSSIAFLLEYVTSAQYLELNIFYWSWICHQLQAGYPVVFPNLHTVLVERRWTEHDPFRELQSLLPAHAFPALRRLSTTLQIANDFVIPHVWATLTHVSLKIFMSLEFVISLSFIRSIPHLQWGHFNISLNSPFTVSDPTPPLPHCTLPHLNTLSIAVHGGLDRNLRSPLTLLFQGLHMPSLRTLSLFAPHMEPWQDRSALHELYSVLASTPAITKLALKSYHPRGFVPPNTPLVSADTVPIWMHATQLAHLELALPKSQYSGVISRFVRRIFSPDSLWLDLPNPASPIRAVTVSDVSQVGIEDRLAMPRIRKEAGKASEVVFEELILEWAGQLAGNERQEWEYESS